MKIHWFKHDTDAFHDSKLKRLRIKYGMQGYGLYWYCIELITSNISESNITFELEHDAELISHDTGIHYELVQEMMQYMVDSGLFENSNGTITCLKIAKRLNQSMTSNPQMRALIKDITEHHDSVMINHDNVTPDKSRVDKSRVDKKIEGQIKLADKLSVSVELIQQIVKHRRDIKHPANTDKKITLVVNDLRKCVEQGWAKNLNDAMDKLDNTEWRTLKPEYLEGKSNGQHKKPNSKRDNFENIDYSAGVGTDGSF